MQRAEQGSKQRRPVNSLFNTANNTVHCLLTATWFEVTTDMPAKTDRRNLSLKPQSLKTVAELC